MANVPAHEIKRAKMEQERKGGDNHSTTKKIEVPVAKVVSHLPEEILEKIFFHSGTAKDLHAVSNGTDQFNRILAPTKTTWAFDMVFPEIFSNLEKEDILNCRLVCQQWCLTVDQDLQSRPCSRPDTLYPNENAQNSKNRNRPLYAPRFQKSLVSKGFYELYLCSPLEIQDFLQKTGDHPQNPILLRSVSLHNQTASENYWELALSFLERFGNELWYACIASWDEDDLPEDRPFLECSPELVVKLIGLMPNLRSLALCGVFEGHANRQLPTLCHLRTLELLVDEANVEPVPFYGELLKTYSSQLQLLPSCELSVFHTHLSFLPNLTQLKEIQLIVDEDLLHWRRFFRGLVAPNLSKLSVIMWESWSISDFLQPLSENLQSLRYLSVRIRGINTNFKMLTPPKFVLENVKTLEIEDSTNVEYNQLLQHLPGLEYLVLCYYQTSNPTKVSFDDTTQWKLFDWINGPSIENSDIWTRLASLKELTLARFGDDDNNGDIEYELSAQKTFTREMFTRF